MSQKMAKQFTLLYLIIMKTILNILLAILVAAVVFSFVFQHLTTSHFFAGVVLMCIASTSFLILNKN